MAHYDTPRSEATIIPFGTASDRVQSFVNHARDRNLWIFDKTFKKWYSPDEYIERFNFYPADADEMLKRCEARNPLEAIETGHQKLSELMGRVFKYMGIKRGNNGLLLPYANYRVPFASPGKKKGRKTLAV